MSPCDVHCGLRYRTLVVMVHFVSQKNSPHCIQKVVPYVRSSLSVSPVQPCMCVCVCAIWTCCLCPSNQTFFRVFHEWTDAVCGLQDLRSFLSVNISVAKWAQIYLSTCTSYKHLSSEVGSLLYCPHNWYSYVLYSEDQACLYIFELL